MMVSRGEIWLTNLNPTKKNNEIGKVRPVLIYQNDNFGLFFLHKKSPEVIGADFINVRKGIIFFFL